MTFYPSTQLSAVSLVKAAIAPTLVGLLGGVNPLNESGIKHYQAVFVSGITVVTFEVSGSLGLLGYAVADEFEVRRAFLIALKLLMYIA